MVPLRFLSEAFGADITWDGTKRTVNIHSEGENVQNIYNEAFPAPARDYYDMGLGYYNAGQRQNYTEAFKWIHVAAVKGYREAQLKLAEMYRDGKGVAQDNSKASKWLLAAGQDGTGSDKPGDTPSLTEKSNQPEAATAFNKPALPLPENGKLVRYSKENLNMLRMNPGDF